MVLGCLHSASLKDHTRYLGGRKKIPLHPPTEPTMEDTIFADLRRAVPKPRAQEARKNAWILATMWRLVNDRVSALQDLSKCQALIRRMGRVIRVSLRTDRKWRSEEAWSEVEAMLGSDPPLHREAWRHIKGWYKAAVDRALPPAWVILEQITSERVELYSYVPPLGTNIPISVQPFPVDDSVPTADEIEWSVTQFCNHRSRGASGMRVEHLKSWVATARKS